MLRELAAKAKAININELALQVAKANEGLILNKQREQLTEGKNGKGGEVGRYTSTPYAIRKSAISSAPFGVVDLKLSGELYKGLNVEFKQAEFSVDSTVTYSKYQIERYGNEIYELQQKNSDEIKRKNSVDIVAEYTKQLGL